MLNDLIPKCRLGCDTGTTADQATYHLPYMFRDTCLNLIHCFQSFAEGRVKTLEAFHGLITLTVFTGASVTHVGIYRAYSVGAPMTTG